MEDRNLSSFQVCAHSCCMDASAIVAGMGGKQALRFLLRIDLTESNAGTQFRFWLLDLSSTCSDLRDEQGSA